MSYEKPPHYPARGIRIGSLVRCVYPWRTTTAEGVWNREQELERPAWPLREPYEWMAIETSHVEHGTVVIWEVVRKPEVTP